jgi:hypothetical protein
MPSIEENECMRPALVIKNELDVGTSMAGSLLVDGKPTKISWMKS